MAANNNNNSFQKDVVKAGLHCCWKEPDQIWAHIAKGQLYAKRQKEQTEKTRKGGWVYSLGVSCFNDPKRSKKIE